MTESSNSKQKLEDNHLSNIALVFAINNNYWTTSTNHSRVSLPARQIYITERVG